MLNSNRSQAKRRGIVLVLVLAMLGLLAVVGITFATYTGQARINNRNFMQSLLLPQADELIDYGLAQLITDTNDIRSAIRGHSMARDMFGNDAIHNGLLLFSPTTGANFSVTNVSLPTGTVYTLTTNILSGDPAFAGFVFTRWIMRMHYTGAVAGNTTGVVDQTFEILGDSGFVAGSNAGRTFLVNITPSDSATTLLNPTPAPGFLGGFVTQLPGAYVTTASANNNTPPLDVNTFTLDGRWLHAFNGSGVGVFATAAGVPYSYYPNYRYNKALGVPSVGLATAPGMDEDYDACDLENWFLAIQSADGQVMIPSFHRPAIIRFDTTNNFNDWNPPAAGNWFDSAARFLRPRKIDGHDAATFPDLDPTTIDPATGRIPYDVDNDGDGVTDSVWVDLGYPARRDPSGRMFKPLFAFMVIGLNGRIPLNTAGNLAAQVTGINVPPTAAADTPPGPLLQGGPTHAVHLGNSVSEIDPTYALQNAFDGSALDQTLAFASPPSALGTPPPAFPNANFANNTQVDTSGVDVRLSQLRALLAGTRPQNNPTTVDTNSNADTDYVLYNTGLAAQQQYFMPNGIASFNTDFATADTNTLLPFLQRSTTPVAGRWGEAESVPGTQFSNPNASATAPVAPVFVNVITSDYSNPVRAGSSLNIRDIILGLPRDAADDNYTTFDPFPVRSMTEPEFVNGVSVNTTFGGEVGDRDAYDLAGALLFPVERMRRWVTPADINGTGNVYAWNPGSNGVNRGTDPLGRVEFNSYFRPPGAPGVVSSSYTVTGGVVASASANAIGAVVFPDQLDYYISGPNPAGIISPTPLPTMASGVPYPYLPDVTNNMLHGFESFRVPNQAYAANANAYPTTGVNPSSNVPFSFTPQSIGGAPLDLFVDVNNAPIQYPTYDFQVNALVHSDGLNDADEMNLYAPDPRKDSPFGPGDIEWLYRQQDVDGVSLSSRLSQLAPISFTNGIDGTRRRRLVAGDSADLNNFVWTNDNPGGAFPTNSRYLNGANAGFTTLNVPAVTNTALMATIANPTIAAPSPTFTLAHRDKKINLNLPLPVSNDPNEPIRQKWINDTYLLLKSVLPPKAVDTAEELAQLSQYVINIVDFRDPDCTMTHWINPDVVIAGVPATPATMGNAVAVPTTAVTLVLAGTIPAPANPVQLDQYGMEYNPVAINEVLAYSYNYVPSGTVLPQRWNRFMAELVNTQTSPELPVTPSTAVPPIPAFNPALDLGGFEYIAGDPYAGGSWDIVFTADDPYSRPDPYRGQLVPFANLFAATPLSQYSFKPPAGVPTTNNPIPTGLATDGFDVVLQPLGQGGIPAPVLAASPAVLPTNYFYALGNGPPSATVAGVTTVNETGTPSPLATGLYNGGAVYNTAYYDVPANTSSLMQTFKDGTAVPPVNFDPMLQNPAVGAVPPPTSPVPIYAGVLPGVVIPPTTNPNPSTTTPLPSNYLTKVPSMQLAATVPPGALYYWVCLRRPANLFAPVSTNNPMVVVDSVRFPIVDATAPLTGASADGLVQVPNNNTDTVPVVTPPAFGAVPTANVPYSVQRYQPYRGGHAVPVPQPPAGVAAVATTPPTQVAIDPRYGYTEQIVVPSVNALLANTTGRGVKLGTMGVYYYDTGGTAIYYATPQVYHTLGWANEYEQGSQLGATTATGEVEPWDYFPFHDRDFTSVAELMLVPGCSPGLFTKQFVEFAPSYANITNIFSAVQPRLAAPTTITVPPSTLIPAPVLPAANYSPPSAGPPAVPPPPPPPYGPANPLPPTVPLDMVSNGVPPSLIPPVGATAPTVPPATPYVQAFATASAPLNWYSGYDLSTGYLPTVPTAINVPVQPHTFPYLNDQFFYSGYGGAATIDQGNQVGGYSADGWFKMFEFFEVPSLAVGAIGPVSSGTNFDWMRQDLKHGQLNLNLIIDEEVFFSLTGKQTIHQANAQYADAAGNPLQPVDQFSQQLLNFNQIQGIAAGNYTIASSVPPNPTFMLATGTPPVPMVVTSTLLNGTPGSAYPVASYPFGNNGLLALDPITEYLYLQLNPMITYRNTPYLAPNYNSLKTAWVQFLSLRHGGSGYVFGFGTGAVGQNYAVNPINGPLALPAVNNLFGTGIPADRPFHSLSYPDIDYTIMRPAALPPSQYTNPVANSAPTQIDTTTFTATNIYTGDPGVRNPTLYFPYPTATYPGTLPTGAAVGTVSTPSVGGVIEYNAVLPPAIPARRLFQIPDVYNPNPGTFPVPNAVPAAIVAYTPPTAPPSPRTSSFGVIQTASNASETGDPYLNNQIPIIPVGGVTVPLNSPGALPPYVPPTTYDAPATTYNAIVSNSVVNIYWPVIADNTATPPNYFASNLLVTAAGMTTTVNVPFLSGVSEPGLGSNSTYTSTAIVPPTVPPTATITTAPDYRQHPYWRSEQIQRVMNLTTTRTHQYAVWITIGFFEVLRQGDLVMFTLNPQLAFDVLGPEVGAANGKNVRYRGFYLVNRLNLTGFNPSSSSAFRSAVVYRNRIQ